MVIVILNLKMTDVTESEFRINVQEMFKALDLDRNDRLDWKECKYFVSAVMKPDGGYDAEDFREKYEAMDKNADGMISKQELMESVIAVARSRNLFIPDGQRPMMKKH